MPFDHAWREDLLTVLHLKTMEDMRCWLLPKPDLLQLAKHRSAVTRFDKLNSDRRR